MTHPGSDASGAGGGGAFQGFIYQRDVSIWLALELLLNTKTARAVTLEPKGDEDVEARIEADEEVPRNVLRFEDRPEHQLIVQCKRRSNGAWRASAICRVLQHGGPTRPSALSRLADPSNRYLLVTSVGVEADAAPLVTKALGHWPGAEYTPAAISQTCPGVEGRVAVLAALDDEKLNARIDGLLRRFHVLEERRAACRQVLAEAAEARMIKRVGDGAWTRPQLLEIVQAHGGFVGAFRDVERFVRPSNWAAFKTAIQERHGVIIRGPSGTGKTRTAEALCSAILKANPDTEVVRVTGGPAKVHAKRRNGPLLFMVEDPWGKYRVDPTADPWNDAIQEVLAEAGPERRFIITSRSDILKARPPHGLSRHWFVDLLADHYRPPERDALFQNRWRELRRDLQAVVVQQGDIDYDPLETPAQIERLFRKLAEGPAPGESPRSYVARSLADAADATLDKVVTRDVRATKSWRWAAIAWGLFQAHRRLSLRITPAIQQGLSDLRDDYDDGLNPFLLYLVDAGMLRHGQDGELSIDHPRVEQGLATAMAESPDQGRRALADLLTVLFSGAVGELGVELVAHLVAGLGEQPPSLRPRLDDQQQAALDVWLTETVVASTDTFEDDLRLAAKVGSGVSEICELARWLTQLRRPRRRDFFIERWEEPAYADDAWYTRVSAHPGTADVCATFVERCLSVGRDNYGENFALALQRLAPSLQASFLQTARATLGAGSSTNAHALASGALTDLDKAEGLLRAAVEHVADVNAPTDTARSLSLINAEGQDDAGEHLAMEHGEALHGAEAVIDRYVERLREERGWRAIRDHPLAPALVGAWLGNLPDNPEMEERVALTKTAIGGEFEPSVWYHNARAWRAAFAPLLDARLAVGGDLDLRDALAAALPRRLSARTADSAADAFFGAACPDRAIQLAADLYRQLNRRHGPRNRPKFAAFLAAAPHAQRDFLLAVFGMTDGAALAARNAPFEVDDDPWTHMRLAEVLASSEDNIAPHVSAVLRDVEDITYDRAQLCGQAVVLAAEAGLPGIVETALGHRYAPARLSALLALADGVAELPEALLKMVEDKSSDVRLGLCGLLSDRPTSRHARALMVLAGDQWIQDSYYYDDEWAYPIGRAASRALRDWATLPSDMESSAWELALATDDREVRVLALETVAKQFGADGFARVVDLALARGQPKLQMAAAEAVERQAHLAASDQIALLTDKLPELAGLWPSFWLASALGAIASSEELTSCARRLAADGQRGALLLPMSAKLAARDPDLANRLAELLPAPTGENLAQALKGKPLARDGLHSVGSAHLTDLLLRRMKEYFEPEQRSPPDPEADPFDSDDDDASDENEA